MKSLAIVIGVLILIFGVGYLVTNTTEEPVVASQGPGSDPETPIKIGTEAANTEETETDDAGAVEESTTAPGVYTTYDADAIAQSDAEHIVLFFHATWCPSCRALENDILANEDSIPSGVEIYKVDFDTATALKRQYGVTTQHSIIEINAAREAESSISHGLTLDDVLATL